MLTRPILIVSTLMASIIGSSVAIAASPVFLSNDRISIPETVAQTPRDRGRGRGVQKDDFMEKLNLNEDQKRQISTIRQKYQGQMERLRSNMQTAQQELENLLTGNASKDRIRTQYQEVTELRQDLANLHFESMLEMREVLTSTQRDRLSQLIQQRREKFRAQFGNDGEQ